MMFSFRTRISVSVTTTVVTDSITSDSVGRLILNHIPLSLTVTVNVMYLNIRSINAYGDLCVGELNIPLNHPHLTAAVKG
jgi:hypothetical protein